MRDLLKSILDLPRVVLSLVLAVWLHVSMTIAAVVAIVFVIGSDWIGPEVAGHGDGTVDVVMTSTTGPAHSATTDRASSIAPLVPDSEIRPREEVGLQADSAPQDSIQLRGEDSSNAVALATSAKPQAKGEAAGALSAKPQELLQPKRHAESTPESAFASLDKTPQPRDMTRPRMTSAQMQAANTTLVTPDSNARNIRPSDLRPEKSEARPTEAAAASQFDPVRADTAQAKLDTPSPAAVRSADVALSRDSSAKKSAGDGQLTPQPESKLVARSAAQRISAAQMTAASSTAPSASNTPTATPAAPTFAPSASPTRATASSAAPDPAQMMAKVDSSATPAAVVSRDLSATRAGSAKRPDAASSLSGLPAESPATSSTISRAVSPRDAAARMSAVDSQAPSANPSTSPGSSSLAGSPSLQPVKSAGPASSPATGEAVSSDPSQMLARADGPTSPSAVRASDFALSRGASSSTDTKRPGEASGIATAPSSSPDASRGGLSRDPSPRATAASLSAVPSSAPASSPGKALAGAPGLSLQPQHGSGVGSGSVTGPATVSSPGYSDAATTLAKVDSGRASAAVSTSGIGLSRDPGVRKANDTGAGVGSASAGLPGQSQASRGSIARDSGSRTSATDMAAASSVAPASGSASSALAGGNTTSSLRLEPTSGGSRGAAASGTGAASPGDPSGMLAKVDASAPRGASGTSPSGSLPAFAGEKRPGSGEGGTLPSGVAGDPAGPGSTGASRLARDAGGRTSSTSLAAVGSSAPLTSSSGSGTLAGGTSAGNTAALGPQQTGVSQPAGPASAAGNGSLDPSQALARAEGPASPGNGQASDASLSRFGTEKKSAGSVEGPAVAGELPGDATPGHGTGSRLARGAGGKSLDLTVASAAPSAAPSAGQAGRADGDKPAVLQLEKSAGSSGGPKGGAASGLNAPFDPSSMLARGDGGKSLGPVAVQSTDMTFVPSGEKKAGSVGEGRGSDTAGLPGAGAGDATLAGQDSAGGPRVARSTGALVPVAGAGPTVASSGSATPGTPGGLPAGPSFEASPSRGIPGLPIGSANSGKDATQLLTDASGRGGEVRNPAGSTGASSELSPVRQAGGEGFTSPDRRDGGGTPDAPDSAPSGTSGAKILRVTVSELQTVNEQGSVGSPAGGTSGADFTGNEGDRPKPKYPPIAEENGWGGEVKLRLSVNADGTIREVSVVTTSGHDVLDEAAATTVKKYWRLKPAMRRGKAVETEVNAIIRFNPNQR